MSHAIADGYDIVQLARSYSFGVEGHELSLNNLSAFYRKAMKGLSTHVAFTPAAERKPVTPPSKPPRMIQRSATIRWNTVHFYGTMEDMTNKDCLRYFGVSRFRDRPQHVEWIDESCCNVRFNDFTAALAALVRVSSMFTQTPKKLGIATFVQQWRQGVNYRHERNEAFMVRIACSADVKPPRVNRSVKKRGQELPYVKRLKKKKLT